MSITTLRRLITSACVAAGLSLAASPAQSAIYSSHFDPPNFVGDALFDVSDACFDSDGFHSNNGDPCSVTWVSATVTIQDAPTTTFSFPQLPSGSAVFDVFVFDGALAGVDSAIVGPAFGDPGANQGPWFIQFFSGTPSLFSSPHVALAPHVAAPPFGFGIVRLYSAVCDTPSACVPNQSDFSEAIVEGFSRVVPEPGSMALLLGAMTLGWVVRNRR